MGTVMWGTDEHLQCITAVAKKPGIEPIEIGGQKNVCIGYKFSVSWAGLPYRTTDDGYVLTVPVSRQYIALDKAGLAELQAEGVVSTPAPTYSIPTGYVLAQYSLWAVLALIVLVAGLRFWWRRRIMQRRTSGVIATEPVLARTKDKSLHAMLSPMLAADEAISHQAYAYDADMSNAGMAMAATTFQYFVALTNKRLIWIKQKHGVLGIGRGDQTTGEIDRAIIERILPHENALEIRRDDGPPMLTLYVPMAGSGYSRENQSAFLADLPRIVGIVAR